MTAEVEATSAVATSGSSQRFSVSSSAEEDDAECAMTFTMTTATRAAASRRTSLEEKYDALDVHPDGISAGSGAKKMAMITNLQDEFDDDEGDEDGEVHMTFAMTSAIRSSAPSRRTSLEDRYDALSSFPGTTRSVEGEDCAAMGGESSSELSHQLLPEGVPSIADAVARATSRKSTSQKRVSIGSTEVKELYSDRGSSIVSLPPDEEQEQEQEQESDASEQVAAIVPPQAPTPDAGPDDGAGPEIAVDGSGVVKATAAPQEQRAAPPELVQLDEGVVVDPVVNPVDVSAGPALAEELLTEPNSNEPEAAPEGSTAGEIVLKQQLSTELTSKEEKEKQQEADRPFSLVADSLAEQTRLQPEDETPPPQKCSSSDTPPEAPEDCMASRSAPVVPTPPANPEEEEATASYGATVAMVRKQASSPTAGTGGGGGEESKTELLPQREEASPPIDGESKSDPLLDRKPDLLLAGASDQVRSSDEPPMTSAPSASTVPFSKLLPNGKRKSSSTQLPGETSLDRFLRRILAEVCCTSGRTTSSSASSSAPR